MDDALERLAAVLEETCRRQPFHTGWQLHDLRSGAVVGARAERPVPAASTRKVAILVAALAAVRAGRLSLTDPVSFDGHYREQIHSGLVQHLDGPLTLSLRDVLVLMIAISDNLATAHVVERVGLDAVGELCAAAGLRDTHHRHALIPTLAPDHPVDATNATTPADQARLLRLILDGAGDADAAALLACRPEDCALALDLLRRQQHHAWLPGHLPPGTVVAHKPGIGWRDVSDAGVVYADGEPAFLLSVYVDELPAELPGGLPALPAGREHIARLTRLCWDELVASAGPTREEQR
jgi:beta-lactamase class A